MRRPLAEALGAQLRGLDAQDAALVVSEPVGNAVRHGEHRVCLHLSLSLGALSVAVSDGSSLVPVQRTDPDDESGRGLLVLGAVTTAVRRGTDPAPRDGGAAQADEAPTAG